MTAILPADLMRHPTKRWSRRTSPPTLVCIHHSATPATVTPQAIARYHVQTKDMPSVQYHYLVTATGTIYQANDDMDLVWHGHDHNVGIGVCLIGDFTATHPPAAQIEAARWLYHELRGRYGDLPLVGHNSAPRASTECPGRTWPEWRHKIEEERIEMQTTKICPHILESYSGTLGKPPVVKVVNPDFAYLTQLRNQLGPEPMLIARWTVDGEPWGEWMKAPEASAERWFTQHAPVIHGSVEAGLAVAFEGANEVPDHLSGPYARHELRRVEILHAVGARAIVGNWAVGNPEMASMPLFERVFAELGYGDVVGTHWYWCDEENLLANIWGMPWHNRAVLGDWLRGLVKVYTEGGRDYLPDLNRGGPWQNPRVSVQQYTRELRIADEWMMRQDDIVGMTVFSIGRALSSRWVPYMVDSFWPSVVAGQQPWSPTWAKYWGVATVPQPPTWIDEARRHKIPFNPGAGLARAITHAGQNLGSGEFAIDGRVCQWGVDYAARQWSLWEWTAQGAVVVHGEAVTS
jgi:hypothetical protein